MSDPRGPHRARRGVLVLAAVAAASTSACGAVLGSSTTPDGDPIPSVQDLYAQTRKATLAARSGHVTGFVTDDGRAVMLDIEGAVDGRNQRVRLRDDRYGTATVLAVKGRYYVTADWDFWAASTGEPKAADALKNRPIVVNADEADRFEDATLGSLIEEAFANENVGLLSRFTDSVSLRHENDHEIWVLSAGDDEVWVDRDSSMLVKLIRSGDEPGELTFDRWDGARRFKAPAKATVFKP